MLIARQSHVGTAQTAGTLLLALTSFGLTGCAWPAGRGGQYFSPPYLSVVTFHLNNAGRFFPYHKSSRNEGDWKRLYEQTLDIVNGKLKEKKLPTISAA